MRLFCALHVSRYDSGKIEKKREWESEIYVSLAQLVD